MGDRRAAGGGRIGHVDAVQQNGVTGIGAAHEERGLPAGAAGLLTDVQARHLPQHIGSDTVLPLLRFVAAVMTVTALPTCLRTASAYRLAEIENLFKLRSVRMR